MDDQRFVTEWIIPEVERFRLLETGKLLHQKASSTPRPWTELQGFWTIEKAMNFIFVRIQDA